MRPTRRLKLRYLIVLFVLLVSIISKPFFIELAYQERGYRAIGGEYMIIPFGIVLAAVVLSIASDIDSAGKKAKPETKKQAAHDGDR